MPLSTVSLWLKRLGLGKRSRLEPPEPPNRYERRHPGELVHVDIKRLGRIRGVGHRITGDRASQRRTRHEGRLRGVASWEYVHVRIDDRSRLAYAEVLDDLTASCAVAFLHRAVTWFAGRGVQVRAVMSDNGSCYIARAYGDALRELGLRHLRIKPGRPRTNGKAERFSSKHCSTNGRTDRSTAAQPNAPPTSPTTSSATTTDAHTAPSANKRRPRG